MSEGKVAPYEGQDWYLAEVHSVLEGQRLIGASLEDKLTVPMTRKLLKLCQMGRLRVSVHKHDDGTFEWVWAKFGDDILVYKDHQYLRKQGYITDRQYWNKTGAMFGYSPADVQAFVEFQTSGEGCDCAQCFPAGPPTGRTDV